MTDDTNDTDSPLRSPSASEFLTLDGVVEAPEEWSFAFFSEEQQAYEHDELFDAPRERVRRARTDHDRVRQWWGPEGFTVPRCEMDVRPGGVHRVDMRAPDGATIPHEGAIEAIDEPERLVIHSRTSENGKEIRQPEVRNTITLGEHDDRTELTFVAEVTAATPDVTDSVEGTGPVRSGSLDSLATHLGEEV